MRIGNIRTDGPVVLGPMSGYTTEVYRDFMKPFGVGLSVTEMTSAVGVINMDGRTKYYVGFGRNYPTALQLFGHSAEDIAEAARRSLDLNPNIDAFDVNMGCPVPKILRSDAGSKLMRDPGLCGDIVRRLKETVDVPITVKIRLGWDSNHMNYMDVIESVTDAGADAVTVHARTKEEHYAGSPHYDVIKDLQSKMSVPLIVSGNIYSLDDAIKAMETTGAEGVMVARGGVGNPFLITQIDRYFKTGERLENPTVSQQIEWCIQLADAVIADQGEETGVRKLRSIAPKFIAGCYRSRELRLRLTEIVTRDDLIGTLEEIDRRMGSERINNGRRRKPENWDSPCSE